MKPDPTTRFSDRVTDYIKYRPGYPVTLYEFAHNNLGVNSGTIIADIGCGTGIFAEGFLKSGNTVIGVEPNDDMRAGAESQLIAYPTFRALKGTAAETGLDDASVDLIVCAQAFHWFCNANTVEEFRRILKPNGSVGLIWNERELEKDRFHIEYEEFLRRFATDYDKVRHDSISKEHIEELFGTDFGFESFENMQVFDLNGLMGRAVSSSYMPGRESAEFPAMLENLKALFAVHEEFGKISVSYKTKFYFCKY